MRGFARIIIILAVVSSLLIHDKAIAGPSNCMGEFVNPFSDIEWNCMFPIRMAGMTLIGGDDNGNPGKISNPICSCKEGLTSRIGISMAFREPTRLMDVVFPQFCLNGLGIDLGNSSVWGDGSSQTDVVNGSIFANVHYYTFLPMFILQIILDFGCVEKFLLDVAYLSEFDPAPFHGRGFELRKHRWDGFSIPDISEQFRRKLK